MNRNRATARARAREAIEDFSRFCERRRSPQLDDVPSGKSGNNAPQMALTKRDIAYAKTVRREALDPEPLPRGIETEQIVRFLLNRGPTTKKHLSEKLGMDMATVVQELDILVTDGTVSVLGSRRRYGNEIAVYGLAGQALPVGQIDADDIEGIVADYISRRGKCRFGELKEVTGSGDAAVTTALTSLIAAGTVMRVGKAGATTYVWNG